MKEYKNISFYRFINIESKDLIKEKFSTLCKRLKILGTLIIANEGLNGMLAGSSESIDKVLSELFDLGIKSEDVRISFSEIKPFNRLRIKLKDEIISLGNADKSNPNKMVGKYVEPEDWNKAMEDKDVILIDTRNHYETSIGTFNGALVPNINTFKDFPDFVQRMEDKKDKKIAMFCTGGVRCEKASSYMLQVGFKEVLHLKGGIIKYLENIPEKKSKWEGECFVFDNRVAIEHELDVGTYIICNGCGEPVSKDDASSDKFKKGIHCPSCFDKLSEDQIKRATERQKQVELAKKRGEVHIGE
ncbi:MAG: hypothetical protein CMN79_05385 [Spirochaetales bacterium]|nr:hypothetical protein [Spirochaetales bacterium]|tara:strand:+ start:650 stop:1555 length:906 start_codon:yes stop_codon:yes gene_type:complete